MPDRTWSFQIIQDGMVVAEGEGPADDVYREAKHYLAMYGQDGDAEAVLRPGSLPPQDPTDQ